MLTMPATTGMMMLGWMIITLVEPTESWNPASLMSGIAGMMGGGMGSMGGGGMGGMGGGGMGGGFRSVPPTDLPSTTLASNQSRDLKTRIVSLRTPGLDGQITYPAAGERLDVGDVAQVEADPRMQAALRRLARDKASSTVAQLVLWGTAGMPWAEVARMSRGWVNGYEVALAQQMVASLDLQQPTDPGRLLVEITAQDESQAATSTTLQGIFRNRLMLGLAVESTVPTNPTGPSVACKLQVQGSVAHPEVLVQLATTDETGARWQPTGKFTLPQSLDADGKLKDAEFGDALAEGLINRLVKVTVTHPSAASAGLIPLAPKEREREAYRVRIDNCSPLLLNGVALVGTEAKPSDPLKVLAGISLAPRKIIILPVSGHSAQDYGLKHGVRVMALDLSGL